MNPKSPRMSCSCIRPLSLAVLASTTAWAPATEVFYDDFTGASLDTSRWLIAEKQWGGDNGGIVHENVSVSDGLLHLTGHGDLYTGHVQGVDHDGARLPRVTRVGGAIATKNYYASGRYEVRLRLPIKTGACSAIWPFHYEEAYEGDALWDELGNLGGLVPSIWLWAGLTQTQADSLMADLTSSKGSRPPYLESWTNGRYTPTDYFRAHAYDISKLDLVQDFGKLQQIYVTLQNATTILTQGSASMGYYKVRNQEIDIETPTGLEATPSDVSYRNARFNNWVGEAGGEFTAVYDDLGKAMNDGQFHTYRFDWHTASDTVLSQRVEFYIDGVLKQTNHAHVPTIGGRFWIGLWFPAWAGTPDFNTQSLDVDWVRITPFDESGDRYVAESYPDDGWWTPRPPADGIPDWWKSKYFQISGSAALSGSSAATADADGDGIDNYHEYLADTDPTSAASHFHPLGMTKAAGQASVSFPSSLNRSYTLYVSPDLKSWTAVPGQSGIPGTGGTQTLTDPTPQGAARFYRVGASIP